MHRFGVSEQKAKSLEKRLSRLNIQEKDVVEKFIRAGGPGGQHVNKASTAVYLKHLPTGLDVKVGRERSQALNRFLAWRLLCEKVEERILKIKSERRKHIEKIRRQKRRRSKRAKEKMLRNKKHQALKKKLRKPPTDFNS